LQWIWYGSVDWIRSDLTSRTSDEKHKYMEYDSDQGHITPSWVSFTDDE
jgi:hypothetical protein